MAHHFEERLDQDHEIQPQVPVVDVPKVEIQPLLHQPDLRGFGAAAAQLMPKGTIRQQFAIGAVVGDGIRTRADQRHVAAQDVEKLRQFVDAGGAQHATEIGGNPRVMSGRLGDAVALFHHRRGAQLKDRETLRVEAAAGLTKQDRPGDSSLIAKAVSNITGDCSTSAREAPRISTARFANCSTPESGVRRISIAGEQLPENAQFSSR